MSRVSDRISAALSTIKCPGCGERVVPSMATETSADEGKRWSFVWLPPRGEVCPRCDFPLSRYKGRLPWIRLFVAGIALLTISLLLLVVAMISGFREWVMWPLGITLAMGVLAFVIGVLGIIVGGRHGPVQRSAGAGGPPSPRA